MALIKCPECQHSVSSTAVLCPNCGYSIEGYMLEKETEEKRLLAQIIPFEYQCPEPRVKVCIRCTRPFDYIEHIRYSKNPNYKKPICSCGMQGIEVDYPEAQFGFSLSTEKYILEKCCIPHNIGDPNTNEYREWMADLYNQIERSEKVSGKSIEAEPPKQKYFGVERKTDLELLKQLQSEEEQQVQPAKNSSVNSPSCPSCHSTDLTKISGMKKFAKVYAFGLFGAGDIGKTWKCNNCGTRF